MSIKLAINGFGRIGRLAFRRAYEEGGFEVVAINDLVDANTLAYLLKYDTTHRGWMRDEISSEVVKDELGNITVNNLIFKGKKIPVLGKKDPKDLKWGEYHGGTYAKAGLEVFHVDARLISDFKTTSGRPNFAYTDNLTKYSYIAASNSGTRSIDVEGSANAKRWVSGSDNRLIKILPATGINTFYSKKNNIFDNFGNEQNLFGLPAYGCGAKTYTNYAMRNLFPNGTTFDDGTSLNYSFTVTGQTDEDITLHFLAN